MHGDPSLGVDNYLVIGLETIGVKNDYSPSKTAHTPTIIDEQMFGFIRDMAHYTQYEIDNAEGYNFTKWHEETIASRSIMADTAINAAYIGTVITSMEAWRDNPENFKSYKERNGSGNAKNAGKVDIDSLDDFFKNPEKFGKATPDQYYEYFQNNGYNPQPLGSRSSLSGVPFEQGEYYRARKSLIRSNGNRLSGGWKSEPYNSCLSF